MIIEGFDNETFDGSANENVVRVDCNVHLKRLHHFQNIFVNSKAKRKIIRAGRRGGKTVGIAELAVREFLKGKRVLYAAPVHEQIDRFWTEVQRSLDDAIRVGIFKKNLSENYVERPGTEQRIKAKTAWNADTLRGDYGHLLIFDEWQLMDENAWGEVGAPMLLDKDGDAAFIYTPPSLTSRASAANKAKDPLHAMKMYKRAEQDKSGRWLALTFTSHDNPYLSTNALAEITNDMTSMAYRQEILAEDIDKVPGALWDVATMIEPFRVDKAPELVRVVVAVDPSATSTELSDEAGLGVAGIGANGHGYVLLDDTKIDSPRGWATRAVRYYNEFKADRIVAEKNNGGEMVEFVIRTIDHSVSYKAVDATRGKLVRAEPVAALYEKGFVHHVGRGLSKLEEELSSFVPGAKSPNRLDWLVWALTDLMLGNSELGLLRYFAEGHADRDLKNLEALERKPMDALAGSEVERQAQEATKSRTVAQNGQDGCPSCGSGLIGKIPGGQKRCNQCGHQFQINGALSPQTPHVSRSDYLSGGHR